MIRLRLMLLQQLRSIRLELSAQLLHLMRPELRNSNLKRCGSLQMVQSETIWVVLFSEHQSLSLIFQNMFQDGRSQSLLEDMPSVTNIEQLMLFSKGQENLKCLLHPLTVEKNNHSLFLISRTMVLQCACITQTNQF